MRKRKSVYFDRIEDIRDFLIDVRQTSFQKKGKFTLSKLRYKHGMPTALPIALINLNILRKEKGGYWFWIYDNVINYELIDRIITETIKVNSKKHMRQEEKELFDIAFSRMPDKFTSKDFSKELNKLGTDLNTSSGGWISNYLNNIRTDVSRLSRFTYRKKRGDFNMKEVFSDSEKEERTKSVRCESPLFYKKEQKKQKEEKQVYLSLFWGLIKYTKG